MLPAEENLLLCRIGPGTPAGDLFRRFWTPAMLSRELPQPDCPPVRVTLLGEQLIAFRTTSGEVGLIQNACPHRGASMFFGRNEEEGLRCVYHGWKFDVSGACTDMPSEPAESNFKSKVKARAYPTREAAGMVWTYMGPAELEPPFPDLVFNTCPPEEVIVWKNYTDCNYLQSFEGGIDSVHVGFLHGTDGPGLPAFENRKPTRSLLAQLEVEDFEWGMRYAAARTTDTELVNVRITTAIVPTIYMVAATPWNGRPAWFVVPIDDNSCWRFEVRYNPLKPIPLEIRPEILGNPENSDALGRRNATVENDYLIDREIQRTQTYTGIPSLANQDWAVVETMGTVWDRTKEHLGTSDKAIIRWRQIMLKAIADLQNGIEPAGTRTDMPWSRIRQGEKNILPSEDWRSIEAVDTEWVQEPPPEGQQIRAISLQVGVVQATGPF